MNSISSNFARGQTKCGMICPIVILSEVELKKEKIGWNQGRVGVLRRLEVGVEVLRRVEVWARVLRRTEVWGWGT